jgi:hypothetical protein
MDRRFMVPSCLAVTTLQLACSPSGLESAAIQTKRDIDLVAQDAASQATSSQATSSQATSSQAAGTDPAPGDSNAVDILTLFGSFQASIQRNCVPCHGGEVTPFGGTLSFAALTSVDAWVKHPNGLIVPGEPLKSPVYNRTIHAKGKVPASVRTNMPFAAGSVGSNDLPEADGQAIFDFVASLGAGDANMNPGGESLADKPTGALSLESPVAASLAKAKYIAHGGAPSAEELRAVTDPAGKLNREELKRLVDTWLASDTGRAKMESFFRLTLDQHDFEYPANEGEEIFGRWPTAAGAQAATRWLRTLQESFVRTVSQLVMSGTPFTEILTTRRHAVTTSILASYSFADGAARPSGFNSNSTDFSQFVQTLEPSDFNDWRFVTFVQNNSVTPYNSIAQIRAVAENGSYNLRAPRVGFFNTLAFQLKNATNVDNDFRVSISQTLIVALNKIFEAGDTTPNGNLAALDPEHAGPETTCYSCHRLLDPMREVFRTAYTTDYLFHNGSLARTPAFAFFGSSGPASSIPTLAETISKHPEFAAGWVSKVCAYANSEPCDETDPAFVQLVDNFKKSSFSFRSMFVDVLSSPIVTVKGGGLPEAADATVPTSQRGLISFARKNHFCGAIDTRYREVLAAKNRTYTFTRPTCELSDVSRSAFDSLPEDKVNRGSQILIQPSAAEPLSLLGYERVCREMATRMVTDQNNAGFDCCTPAGVDAAINDMVQFVMGLPSNHPRHNATKTALRDFYSKAQQSAGLLPLAAARETFVLACTAPDTLGVGL